MDQQIKALFSRLLNPDDLGHAASARERDIARFALGKSPAETDLIAYFGQHRIEKVVAQAIQDIAAERRRQVDGEGYEFEHDNEHVSGEIAAYAAFFALPPAARQWPATETGYGSTLGSAIVPTGWHVPEEEDRRRELVKAGALILAEIERLDRAALKSEVKP